MVTRRSLYRLGLNVALDGILAALAVPAARWLAEPTANWLVQPWTWLVCALAVLLAGAPLGLSRQYWRFIDAGDLLVVAAASVAGACLVTTVLSFLGARPTASGFTPILALTLAALLAGPRVLYGRLQGRRQASGRGSEAWPADAPKGVLVVGEGEDADLFIRASSGRAGPSFRVVGLLALGSRQTGRRIHGHTILGSVDAAGAVLDRLQAEGQLPAAIVIATPDLAGPTLAGLLDDAERRGLPVRRAPRPTALRPATRGAVDAPLDLKPVAIEDLLNRPQVALDREAMARLVQGRRVLVTGAGGTIGSELARQIAALGPDQLVLLDNGEYALWQIDLELAEEHPSVARHAIIADIRDEARIRPIFEQFRPELVFHAAALKHVPIVEANPSEGLLTNALGTRQIADAARATGSRAMVLISTDKAVNPTSVMGASKRLAEMYCQSLDIAARQAGVGMRCITVRFGNVLGSTGSVVPLFRRQLERGGPLTVTHPDMRRYFMTVREAVGLVLQASVVGADERAAGTGGDGGIFVLDMGEPVKIVDLARQMIRLAGLRPDSDVAIRYTGLRPGEKLSEELFHGKEPPAPTGHPGLLMATPRTADAAIVGRAIDEIAFSCRAGQPRLALSMLARLVPEFDHNATGDAGSVRA